MRRRRVFSNRLGGLLVTATLALTVARPSEAGVPAVGARAGLPLTEAAAAAWAPDAKLIYVENDEPPDAAGRAPRWSYLFFSAARAQARGYSVRDGKIAGAANLDFRFESLPIGGPWIEAERALGSAAAKVGGKFAEEAGGQVANLVLVRSGLADDHPAAPTWLVVYAAPNAPSLFVVVDATNGEVLKTWRG